MWFADVSNKNTTCVSVDPLSSPNLGQLHGSGSSPSLASSGDGSQGDPSIAPGVPVDCLHSSESHASSDSSRSGARDGAVWRDSPQVLDCWTIPEIESRLQKIYEEQGMVRHKGKIQTPLRHCIVEPNRHSKRKSDLQDYVENHLRIHITRNETIGELQKKAIRRAATTCFGHAASSCSHARSRSPAPRPRDEQADVAPASPGGASNQCRSQLFPLITFSGVMTALSI